jgi:hypothetical protein
MYEDYSDESQRYATEPPEVLQKRLKEARKKMDKAVSAHSNAIAATTSTQSQSMRRAHAGNVVSALSNEILWLELALQIQEKYPEYSYPNRMPVRKNEAIVVKPLDVIHSFETAYPIVKDIVERLGLNAQKFYQANQVFCGEMVRFFGPRHPQRNGAGIPLSDRYGPEWDAWQEGNKTSHQMDAENEAKGVRDHTPYFTATFLAFQFYHTLDYRYYLKMQEAQNDTTANDIHREKLGAR